MKTKRPKTGYGKNYLRNLRETKLFITQTEAAHRIGMRVQKYNQIELGKARPAIGWIPRIAGVFDIPTSVLCEIYNLGGNR